MGACGLTIGGYAVHDLIIVENRGDKLRMGFANDAPADLWAWSREADWYETGNGVVRCRLCPHLCILGENDRGFCRARVVKEGKLYSLVYGNPCSAHVDPMEKKPLFHFLPAEPVLSIATAGCNLRCLNCQNWEISQSKPEETKNADLLPETLVQYAVEKKIPAIAYTYSEPIIFYEYVLETATLAKEEGIRNVLVTAGFILEKPLRKLCRVIDAANVDLKSFSQAFYKKVTGARLKPVLRALEVMREEGVWVEVTRLVVPAYSDDLEDIRAMCHWIYRHLGADTPLHFSRFHPAYKLTELPQTPVETLDRAREIALEVGLHYVFVGNVAKRANQNTSCPRCGRQLIVRRGYSIISNQLEHGNCPCGQSIAGVWQ